jgi:hypothetical protein
VLLNEIERLARDEAYRTISIEAIESKPLGPLIVPPLRQLLFELDPLFAPKRNVPRLSAAVLGAADELVA